jgi:hypothetical protein
MVSAIAAATMGFIRILHGSAAVAARSLPPGAALEDDRSRTPTKPLNRHRRVSEKGTRVLKEKG